MSTPRDSSIATHFARGWNDFFFQDREVYAAVYFRILLASWTALFFLPRLPHIAELYTNAGVHVHHPWLVQLGAVLELPLYAAALVIAVLFALLIAFGAGGANARWVHLPIVVILAYLFSYDISTVRGYGQLAFYQWLVLLCLPYERLRDSEGNVFRAPRWGLRLATMLFSSVYLFSVCAKTIGGEGWFDGRTLYYTFHGRDYGRFLLSEWFPISLDVAKVLGWATLASECFIGFALWHPRTARLAMFVCVGMHTMMALTMRVSILFHLLMVGHLPLFFSTQTWERIAARILRSKSELGARSLISDLRRTPM